MRLMDFCPSGRRLFRHADHRHPLGYIAEKVTASDTGPHQSAGRRRGSFVAARLPRCSTFFLGWLGNFLVATVAPF